MQSNSEFGYLKPGAGQLCKSDSNMMMNITVHRLDPGGVLELHKSDEEMAVLLMEGDCSFEGPGLHQNVVRKSCIDDPGYCLHVCRDNHVQVLNHYNCVTEILVQTTKNDRDFEPQFYTPENTRRDTFGKGQFDGKAERSVTTYFDIHNAPYSNMVCGEIVQPQGGWSSYPPHEHPHPEVYYYRFGHPNGFGACFLDDNVYKIADRSFAAIEGGKYHPQVTAPGYAMMYVWMIRHFDGYPWDERNFQQEHKWLLEGK